MDLREFWLRVRFVIEHDPGTIPFTFLFAIPWVILSLMDGIVWFVPTLVYLPITVLIIAARKSGMGTVFNWYGWDEWREEQGE